VWCKCGLGGLKICRGQPHGGSIPPPGTKIVKKLIRETASLMRGVTLRLMPVLVHVVLRWQVRGGQLGDAFGTESRYLGDRRLYRLAHSRSIDRSIGLWDNSKSVLSRANKTDPLSAVTNVSSFSRSGRAGSSHFRLLRGSHSEREA